jgi:hypothetical protein
LSTKLIWFAFLAQNYEGGAYRRSGYAAIGADADLVGGKSPFSQILTLQQNAVQFLNQQYQAVRILFTAGSLGETSPIFRMSFHRTPPSKVREFGYFRAPTLPRLAEVCFV